MEKLTTQERQKQPRTAAHEIGRTACNRVLGHAPYVSLDDYLNTYANEANKAYDPEKGKMNKNKIIESNSIDLFRVPNSKSMDIMTESLDGNTALAVMATDKKGTRHVYMQNFDKDIKNQTKSIDTLSEALYHGLPKGSIVDRAILLTPAESDEKGNPTESPEDKLLTKFLSQTFDTAMEAKGQIEENSVYLQVLTYKEKRYIGDEPVTLRIECKPDGLSNALVGNEVIKF